MLKFISLFQLFLFVGVTCNFDAKSLQGKWQELFRSEQFPFTQGGTDVIIRCHVIATTDGHAQQITLEINYWDPVDNRWQLDYAYGSVDEDDPSLYSFIFAGHVESVEYVPVRIVYTSAKHILAMVVDLSDLPNGEKYGWILGRDQSEYGNMRFKSPIRRAFRQLKINGVQNNQMRVTKHGVAQRADVIAVASQTALKAVGGAPNNVPGV